MADQTTAVVLGRTSPAALSSAAAHYNCEFKPFFGIAKVQVTGLIGEAVLRNSLGVALPCAGKEVEAGEVCCAWLGPREWLLSGSEPAIADLVHDLAATLGDEGLPVNLTHAAAVYVLRGRALREVLAGLCPLDLSEAAAPVGFATRSLLADTGMFLARKTDEGGAPVFVLVVDQAMAVYAARMLATPVAARGSTS
jgi:sarcosine oxidase subunit gamma